MIPPSQHPSQLAKKAFQQGLACHRAGALDQAIEWYGKALGHLPNHVGILNNLALAQKGVGALHQAHRTLQRAITLKPDYPESHYHLGTVQQAQGRSKEAVAALRQALHLQPDHFLAHYHLGLILAGLGQLEAAASSLEQSLAIRPDSPEAANNLGLIRHDQERLEEAASWLDKALRIKPDYGEAHSNRGVVWVSQGEPMAAQKSYRQAITCNPHLAEAYNNLGKLLLASGKSKEGVALLQKALSLKPDYLLVLNNLAVAWMEQGRLAAAEELLQKAHDLHPENLQTLNNLANVFKEQGRLDQAISCLKKVLTLDPGYTKAHSNLLMLLHYSPNYTVEAIEAEYRRWRRQHELGRAQQRVCHTNNRDPQRRIRIGFVSGAFFRHPVGYLTLGFIETFNQELFELYCYSSSDREDDFSQRIRSRTAQWRGVSGLSHRALSAMIEKDAVDILVDLSGHGANSRLLAFVEKPAPIQVKWVGGQFNTSGLTCMDYFISDSVATPPDQRRWYAEQVLYLPDGYVCYEPPHYSPPVNALPALTNGYVTFGCFNNLAKINLQVVAWWAQLLREIPDSRLILITKQLSDPQTRKRFERSFCQAGVLPQQLQLCGWLPHAQLLASYNQIDIALDPFPYSGGLTSCESLWMGVPVVTLPGPTFAGRHAATHLTQVGMADWVVDSPLRYRQLVAGWCENLPGLSQLRRELRGRVERSPLCDKVRFTHHLEALFRQIWQRWCGQSLEGS
ncbi:MAG: tetratricopeptide repeat protein [Magnetococcales bacterium]|nr:tetratricopeptide repeat protein [Magnetococcales bacterium]